MIFFLFIDVMAIVMIERLEFRQPAARRHVGRGEIVQRFLDFVMFGNRMTGFVRRRRLSEHRRIQSLLFGGGMRFEFLGQLLEQCFTIIAVAAGLEQLVEKFPVLVVILLQSFENLGGGSHEINLL